MVDYSTPIWLLPLFGILNAQDLSRNQILDQIFNKVTNRNTGLIDLSRQQSAGIMIDNLETSSDNKISNAMANFGIQTLSIERNKLDNDFSQFLMRHVSNAITTWVLPKSLTNSTQLLRELKAIDEKISGLKNHVFIAIDNHGLWWQLYDRRMKKLQAPRKLNSPVIVLLSPR